MTEELAEFYADFVLAQKDAIRDHYGPAKLTSMWLDMMNEALSAGMEREKAEAFVLREIKDEVYAAEEDSWAVQDWDAYHGRV